MTCPTIALLCVVACVALVGTAGGIVVLGWACWRAA